MVDMPVAVGDGDEPSEEDITFFAFEEMWVVDTADFEAVGVASKPGDKELDVFEVASGGIEEQVETFTC